MVLLAEDNPADVFLIREALSLHGGGNVDVTVVTDGEQALDFVLRRNRFVNAPIPDLIVLDLNLPKSDGSEVLRTIRADARMADVAVVILTSSDSPTDRSNVQQLGANSYLTKPSELDAFLALGKSLMSFLEGKREERGGAAGAC